MEIRKTPNDFIASSKQKFVLSQARLKPGNLELALLSLQGSLEDGLRSYLLLHGHGDAQKPLHALLEALRTDAKHVLAQDEAKRVQAMSRVQHRIAQGEAVTLTYDGIQDYMHFVADVLLRYGVLVVVPETRSASSTLAEQVFKEQRAGVMWRRSRLAGQIILSLLLVLVIGAAATLAFTHSSALLSTYDPPMTTPESVPSRPPVTPTASTGLAPGQSAQVNVAEGDSLALRMNPGIAPDNPIRLYVSPRTTVYVLEGPVQVNGVNWWKVRAANQEGWCREEYLLAR
jgi:hypothetical protein